jgi:energy-coupling factor transporter ATP-binding protein EcfA2
MTTVTIGIAGRKGVGKSTLAEMLADMIPDTRVVAFADALKDDVLSVVNRALDTDYHRDDLERDKAAVWGPILQGWGELCRRTHGQDYWVDRLATTLPPLAIIPDVRYLNEVAFIKCQPNGLIVFVEGDDRREQDARSATHPSELLAETSTSFGDVLVTNDGSLEHLRDQARYIARLASNLADMSHLERIRYEGARVADSVARGGAP